MSRISVVIPTYNRPAELRACLAGFAAQTVPREVFEIVVVDDGSTESMEPVVLEFEPALNLTYRRIANSGPSLARNAGIATARAPLLVLYDDDLCPRPGLIEYCLRFHESWPQEGHAALLWFRLDAALQDQPLLHWAFPRMYPFPAAAGVFDWQTFWSGTLTCKKSIFQFARFNEEFRFLEDAELALRLNRRLDLRVHFERRLMGLYTLRLTLAQFLARSYRAGYYGYRLARNYPGAWGGALLYEPEMVLVPPQELHGMVAATRSLLDNGLTVDSPAYRMFSALCTRAEAHAYAEGWLNARAGGQPEPPGTLGRFFPAETSVRAGAGTGVGPEITPPKSHRDTLGVLSAAPALEDGMDLAAYRRMLDAVVQAAPPYPGERFSGRGIVLCGGGETYFPCAWVCIQMLRRSGCSLPIELWYRGPAEMTPQMIALLEPMGVSCVDSYAAARLHPVRRLDGWELKSYAIANSRFEEVLYLDSDNIALRNPEFLFSSAGYIDNGAVFWPDRYRGPGSGQEWLKREAWTICGVPYRVEPEIESGQMLIDKRRCWHALHVALHLNEHSDFYYAFFLGDKDTFHLAWHRCGRPYCLVPTASQTLGRSEVIVQHDFEGNPLFQHRNGAKWTISGSNNRIPGFAQEEECLDCLAELASAWSPPVRRLPEQFTAAEQQAYLEICAARFFQYRFEGVYLRTLELRPDFQIGRGSAEMETAWMIEEDKDGVILLSIRSAHAPTCFLRKEHDGIWHGRWLVYDRKRVQLAMQDPSAAAPAADVS